MDRSFLVQPEVIAAAQRFVAVRLATYEDPTEGQILKSLARTGSGQLENTVFAILSPDGKRPLLTPTRSARQVFADAQEMAAVMTSISSRYRSAAAAGLPELPLAANVHLAIDIAACDNLPLAIIFGADKTQLDQLAQKLRVLAWSQTFRGRFTYVSTASFGELSHVTGARAEPGIQVVQPDRFGESASLLKVVSAQASMDEMATALTKALALYHPSTETFQDHVRDGQEQGAFWETVMPVTDPMERRARQRR
jgi:hypothetical protein